MADKKVYEISLSGLKRMPTEALMLLRGEDACVTPETLDAIEEELQCRVSAAINHLVMQNEATAK
jgi:DNA-binding Xre family transcriptional regulator